MNIRKGDSGVTQMKTNKVECFGEMALPLIIIMNSFGVVLMLYSGTGISAISSMTYALSEVMPAVTLGTWTYIFQGSLVLSLMILKRKFVPQYLLSFIVGFGFGLMVDVHKYWLQYLPTALPFRIFYLVASFFILCTGVALSNRCKMPMIPTDLFPKELSEITGIAFSKIKMSFDLICVAATVVLTLCFFGGIRGLGIGTILCALLMGKGISVIGGWIDKNMEFITITGMLRHTDSRHHGRHSGHRFGGHRTKLA